MSRTVLRVTVPVPALGLDVGDLVVEEPGASAPLVIVRALSTTPARIAALRLSGALVASDAPEGHRPALTLAEPATGHQDDLEGFHGRLRRLLRDRGLTQQQLAERIGVRQSMVSRWTLGGLPRPPRVAALADALGVSTAYLLTGTGPGEQPPALQVMR